jgi:hypothetical protein
MQSRCSRVLKVLTVCALGILAAQTAAPQSAFDPCKMLTSAEVSSALRTAIDDPGDPVGNTGCSWGTAPRATLSLADAGQWLKLRTPLPGITKTATSLGDDAFFATLAGTSFTTLTVKKGPIVVMFRIYGVPSPAEQVTMEKALAAIVLAKL